MKWVKVVESGTHEQDPPATRMQYDEFHCPLTLDPKGRLTLPAQLRSALGKAGVEQLVAVANQGNRGGLSFFTPDDYRRVVKGRVRDADPFARNTVVYLRAVDSTSQTLDIDGSGRVLVPALLRKLAGFEKELVAFSSLDWFEVWDNQRWERAFDQAMDLWDEQTGPDSLAGLPGGPQAGGKER